MKSLHKGSIGSVKAAFSRPVIWLLAVLLTAGLGHGGEAPTANPALNRCPTSVLNSPVRADVRLSALTHGDGVWVAVGDYGTILHSPDGRVWSRSDSITRSHLRGVAYDRGIFVAVGDEGVILTSRDGITWTKRDSSVTGTLRAVAAGRGEFVAVGSNSTIVVSKNARVWTQQRSCVVDDLRQILFLRNRFLIVGTRTMHTSSLTGRSSLASWPSPVGFSTISVGPHGFVGVERDGHVLTSSNPRREWERLSATVPGPVLSLVWGNDRWVAVGEGGLTAASSDGVIWSESERITCADLHSVHHAQDRFIAVGNDGTILLSEDGVDGRWEQLHP